MCLCPFLRDRCWFVTRLVTQWCHQSFFTFFKIISRTRCPRNHDRGLGWIKSRLKRKVYFCALVYRTIV